MTEGGLSIAEALVRLEPVGHDSFRSTFNQSNAHGALFGGQAFGQSLRAAATTVAGWPAHSATAQFLRAGQAALPVDYAVERVRDGRRYAARRVIARQAGKVILDMLCSFHDPEPGPAYQPAEEKALPAPEDSPCLRAHVRANAERLPQALVRLFGSEFPIEIRPMADVERFSRGIWTGSRDYWLRMPSALGITDPSDSESLLAFMSDYWMASTPLAVHGGPGTEFDLMATLGHSVWFHEPAPAGEWLLFRTDCPWTGSGRGLVRGRILDRGWRLLATVAQEVMMRRRPTDPGIPN